MGVFAGGAEVAIVGGFVAEGVLWRVGGVEKMVEGGSYELPRRMRLEGKRKVSGRKRRGGRGREKEKVDETKGDGCG